MSWSTAINLKFLREAIDKRISFWNMEPVPLGKSIFARAHPEFRAMQWSSNEYLLGTDSQFEGIKAQLRAGREVPLQENRGVGEPLRV